VSQQDLKQLTPPETLSSVTATRQAIVDKARENWIQRLIDLSRRNNLLYFRELKTGSLNLSWADPPVLADLLVGNAVPLSRLAPDQDQTKTAARVREISRRARINMEEKGLQTLFLALGMATWPSADNGRPPSAAVLLVPVSIESRGRESGIFTLRRIGDIQINPVLLHVLDVEHGCVIMAEQVLVNTDATEDTRLDPVAVFERLTTAAVKHIKGFRVTKCAVLCNFSFQKMAMVQDLRERAAELAAHDVIAAIAGDAQSREAIRKGRHDIDPKMLDRIPPDNEFLILDADSSQQRVITAVLEGQHGVIQGPPGTGKSQTIANLIASLVAQGRRVLFVAEKSAALEVVLRRLQSTGLGHLALDLHGVDVSRREIIKRLSENLALVRETPSVNSAPVHHRFTELRRRLNNHARRLHTPRAPSGLSVYDLQGRLLKLPPASHTTVRWHGQTLAALDANTFSVVRDLLVEAGGFEGLFLRDHSSPWVGVILPDGAAVQQAFHTAMRISHERLPALCSSLKDIMAATQLSEPSTLDAAKNAVTLLTEVAAILKLYQPEIFRQDFDAWLSDLAPASRGTFAALWAWCFNTNYRKARHAALLLRHTGAVPSTQLYTEVENAAAQLRRWRELAAGSPYPCPTPNLDTLCSQLEALLNDLEVMANALGRQDLTQIPLDELSDLFKELSADTSTPYRLPRLFEIEQAIQQQGVGSIITELRDRKPQPELWPLIFEYAWLNSCLDQSQAEDPSIAGFNGRSHELVVDEFRRRDHERLRLAAARIQRRHAERVIEIMNKYPDQAALVRREVEKRARYLPLRKLLANAPDVLMAVCPCWMASPLSISQLLDADHQYFDIVIFDEASQVPPEDAVTALLRASQVIVAGDKHQLPPTMFFATGENEEDEADLELPTVGFESLLDLLSSFLEPWLLEWHYRSHDEALIAFSNRHIYGDRLITFPSPGGSPSISHVLVPYTSQDGQEESSSEEVRRVVDLVLKHASTRPHETLGVITMGIRHALRIEAALDAALRSRPELDDFFSPNREERFFIKNLERVQGDERDAIILSVGYGKDRSGKLPYRFGPLLTQGGERRLNVAVTRARHRMTLVSSFDHYDMDPNRSKARGVELLRLYIQYAASKGKVLGDHGASGELLNPFEAGVFDVLTAQGIPLVPQLGVSGYRIDMAAQHPEQPGRFVLAIECDGATYHSPPTARDRDRLRQQHLEALGWRFHRIWSTDWFMRREEEIRRTIDAFEAAVRYVNQTVTTTSQSVQPSTTVEKTPSNSRLSQLPKRRPRPKVPARKSIQDYTNAELIKLVQWIQSDGLLRTDDEILEEMARELGFRRRGAKIDAAIRRAIDSTRKKQKAS
jgi:hypothetical protein